MRRTIRAWLYKVFDENYQWLRGVKHIERNNYNLTEVNHSHTAMQLGYGTQFDCGVRDGYYNARKLHKV